MTPQLEHNIREWFGKMEGWCTPEKAFVLIDLVMQHKPNLSCELGIFGGKSILALGLAIKQERCGTIIGIDPWEVGPALEGEVGKENAEWWAKLDMEKIYTFFINVMVKNELTNECRWIRTTAERGVRLFDNETVNLLHQDSNHSELVSCRQVELWRPKMAKDSLWILDDSDWETQSKAVELIQKSGFRIHIQKPTFTVFKMNP